MQNIPPEKRFAHVGNLLSVTASANLTSPEFYNFTVAGVAGEANAPEVLAETYNVNVTDGTITFESYDPGAGVMKGTFIGKADCRKGSNDTVEIDMSAAFELKPE